jgi:hypothetical protein
MVTVRSIPDLALLAQEAANHNVPAYQAIGEAIRNFFVGMPKTEQHAIKDLFDVGMRHQIGAVAKQDFEGYKGGSLMQTGVRMSMKLNLIERWDYALRSTTVSIVSRRLAQLKDMTWETMGTKNQERLGLYGFEKPEWDVIRSATDTVAGNKRYTTPDLIQEVPENKIIEALKAKGAKNINETRIQQYRDSLESKLREYIQDREEHVILKPGVLDEYFITLGHGLPENDAFRQVMKLFTQFKLYSVAYARVGMGSVLYGKGAKDFKDATLGGKGDYLGAAKLMGYMMGLKYASMTIDNLLNGLTPPSLTSGDTWLKMMTESAGIYGMFVKIDPDDVWGSVGRSVAGPGPSDIAKLVSVITHGIEADVSQIFGEGEDYSKFFKSLDKLTRGFVPKYPYSAFVLNNLLLKEWEDYANPGAREKYLNNIYQDTGAEPIF